MTGSILLYVGDERGCAESEECLERLETETGLEVRTKPTARDGLDFLEERTRDIAAVVSDNDLPNADGLEVLERVRDRRPDVPFVLMTRVESEEVLHEAVSAGVTDCLHAGASTERYELLARRLEDAVERRRAEQRLERANDRVPPRLYEVTTDTTLTLEERIERVLEIGTEEFGYGVGYFTRIDDGIQEIRTVVGDHDAIHPGRTDPREETYCRRAIESDDPVLVGDALKDGWADDPAYEAFELRCYLGARVEVDGELYGTFCFGDERPRKPDVLETQASTVKLLARWIGYELQRRSDERELERQNERLEEFVSAVSHDLRSPLEVATGYLELLEASLDEDAEDDRRDYLETVDRALERITVLIEDTLTLAREGRRVDECEDVSLAETATTCWEVVDSDEAHLEVTTEATVSADERRLRRILENLLRNAVEHGSTSPRSQSHEDAVEHGGDDVTIEVGDLESAPGFYVADDGPGIPPAERDRIFDRGYSTGGTTGFGLAIVERIVTAHGWTIDVTESERGGARFEIRTNGEHRRRENEGEILQR
ncbi:sensor histidine kinase [Natrialbaceae archaeon A-gly3]